MLSRFGTDAAGLAACASAVLLPDGTLIPEVPFLARSGLYPGHRVMRSHLLGSPEVRLPGVTGAVINRKAWTKHRFDPRFIYCDTFLWLEILCEWDYIFINEALTGIRIHLKQGQM